MNGSIYEQNLTNAVIENSEATEWAEAVKEWDIVDCEEDWSSTSVCTCGKEGLRYLYTIRNRENGNILFPIGSECIHKFERADLNDQLSAMADMFGLLHAVGNNEFLSLSPKLFSRKLLAYLYEVGAFNTRYNSYNGYTDYQFMVDMFNKRNKKSISTAQNKKIMAILLNSIKPYLQKELAKRVRN